MSHRYRLYGAGRSVILWTSGAGRSVAQPVQGTSREWVVDSLRNFIGGQEVEAVDGTTAPVVDPSTGEAYAEAPVSGPKEVDRAVQVAAEAFASWKRTTPSERSLAPFRIADALEARAGDLVAA